MKDYLFYLSLFFLLTISACSNLEDSFENAVVGEKRVEIASSKTELPAEKSSFELETNAGIENIIIAEFGYKESWQQGYSNEPYTLWHTDDNRGVSDEAQLIFYNPKNVSEIIEVHIVKNKAKIVIPKNQTNDKRVFRFNVALTQKTYGIVSVLQHEK